MHGSVVLRWNGGLYAVRGQKTVKIALPTGTPSHIEDHWAEVHGQVEAIIQKAKATLNEANLIKQQVVVTSLQRAEINQMMGQVRHDILAADDGVRTNKIKPSGLAETIQNLVRASGSVPVPDMKTAHLWAQDTEFREAKRNLLADDPGSADKDITGGEIDVDPSLIAILRDLAKIPNPRDTRMKLDPEIFRALCAEPENDIEILPSPVSARLAENTISIPRQHPDRLQLGLDLKRTIFAAQQRVQARRLGDPATTPERPPLITPLPAAKTLTEARDEWIKVKKPVKKQQDDNLLYVNAFISLCGDVPVNQVTRNMVRAYRDLLAQRPRNMPNKIRCLPLRDQVTWGADQPGCALLTPNTVNAKGIGSISVLMELAYSEEWVEKNPCHRLDLHTNGNAVERLPYDAEDINRLGVSPVYARGPEWVAQGGAAAFWFPLLGMFVGARLEEFGQLLVSDIRQEGNIHYFDFIQIDDEAKSLGKEARPKKLKTKASRRKVPVHPYLIAIGFLRYVERMKAGKKDYLFPDLKTYRGRRTKEWSKWWGGYADEYITQSEHKVFHSFRHGFLERFRNITGNEEAGQALAGHRRHMYGQTLSLEKRYEIISSLSYPGVDLSLFERAAMRWFK